VSSVAIPATIVVALSLYFFRLPLLVTVPLVFGPWLAWQAVLLIHNAHIARQQESLETRYKRWYGDRWREELAMVGVQ
jgi:hypothetical protein